MTRFAATLVRSLTPALVATDAARGWRRRLDRMRRLPEYEEPFVLHEPLVSVVVPTHTAPPSMWDLAIPSLLEQAYPRLEVIVAVRKANIDALAIITRQLPRLSGAGVKLVVVNGARMNLPSPRLRWLSAGTVEQNGGMRAAAGHWVMNFSHDDVMLPGTIEALVCEARNRRLEFCYSKNVIASGARKGTTIGASPPVRGNFNLQGSVRHRALNFIQMQLLDALFGRPNDWGTVDRFDRAGVRMGFLNRVTCEYYPSQE